MNVCFSRARQAATGRKQPLTRGSPIREQFSPNRASRLKRLRSPRLANDAKIACSHELPILIEQVDCDRNSEFEGAYDERCKCVVSSTGRRTEHKRSVGWLTGRRSNFVSHARVEKLGVGRSISNVKALSLPDKVARIALKGQPCDGCGVRGGDSGSTY